MSRLRSLWDSKYFLFLPIALFLFGSLAWSQFSSSDQPKSAPINQLYSDSTAGNVDRVDINDSSNKATVGLKQGDDYEVSYPAEFADDLTSYLQATGVNVEVHKSNWFVQNWVIFILPICMIPMLILPTLLQFLGKFKYSDAALTSSVRFKDVGGADEIIREVRQTVDALKNPERYRKFGVKPLRGFVLVGQPGTGKTLLAEAIAGEAGVPFFSISSTDILGHYLNDGPRAVRKLFDRIRSYSAAILFIDELDSIGAKRSSGTNSGARELNNILNELLRQINGFDDENDRTMLLVIGATNRPDDLDPAILRSGRLSMRFTMTPPDAKGRRRILKLNLGKLASVADDVNVDRLAKMTCGMTGAQIADVVNRAGLLAVREETDKPIAKMEHFVEALSTVEAGDVARNREIAEHERKITACHESGHVLVALILPQVSDPQQVTIISRGAALGLTRFNGNDEVHVSVAYLKAELAVVMGGRAAEKLVLGKDGYTSGAMSDLQFATEVATNMVTKWGMSPLFTSQVDYDTAGAEAEIDKLVKEAEAKATEILSQNHQKLEALIATLLDEETLDADAIAAAIA